MGTLLKADLKRMFTDKLFMIACIIGAGLSLMTPILYAALGSLIGPEEMELVGDIFNSKSILTSSFAPLNNFGLILPIFLGIIINKDFSNGTIRNKIICGKPRYQIYLSIFISSIIVMIVAILGYAIIGFGLGAFVVDYSSTVTLLEDIGFILLTLLFGALSYAVLGGLIAFLFTNTKNIGLGMVFYFASAFVLTLLATIFVFAIDYLTVTNGDASLIRLFEFLCNINIFYVIDHLIATATSYSIENIIWIVVDVLIYVSLLCGFGIIIFKKKDLK